MSIQCEHCTSTGFEYKCECCEHCKAHGCWLGADCNCTNELDWQITALTEEVKRLREKCEKLEWIVRTQKEMNE